MIDTNITHIEYCNFPEHYTQEVFDLSKNCLNSVPEDFLDVEYSDEPLDDLILGPIPKQASIVIKDIHFELHVFVSLPAKKMFDVHIDKGRHIGINFPIQVDPDKGYLLVMKDDNYSALGEQGEGPGNIAFGDFSIPKDSPGFTKWPNAKEENMQKICFDKPMMLNTKRPHSYVNYSNKPRIIVTLMHGKIQNTKISDEEVREKFKEWL